MSEQGRNWYKAFAVGIAGTYLFFLIMISQCTFSFNDPLSLFNTFLCVLYVGFGFLFFIIGVPMCLVGIEHAKRHGQSRNFYFAMIIYFIAGLIGIISYRFV